MRALTNRMGRLADQRCFAEPRRPQNRPLPQSLLYWQRRYCPGNVIRPQVQLPPDRSLLQPGFRLARRLDLNDERRCLLAHRPSRRIAGQRYFVCWRRQLRAGNLCRGGQTRRQARCQRAPSFRQYGWLAAVTPLAMTSSEPCSRSLREPERAQACQRLSRTAASGAQDELNERLPGQVSETWRIFRT